METSCSRFTPAEGGARLAVMAGTRNTLAVEYASFIATRLVYEEAYKIRGCYKSGRQRSVYVTLPSRVPCVSYELSILTDLTVATGDKYDNVEDWADEVERKEVIVCTSSVLKRLLEESQLKMERINVLVLDSCHRIYVDECLQFIMRIYKECDEENQPRILALTYPLFGPIKKDLDIKDTKETDTLGEKETEDLIKNETADKTIDLKDTMDKDVKDIGEDEKKDTLGETQTDVVVKNDIEIKTLDLQDIRDDKDIGEDAKTDILARPQTADVVKHEAEAKTIDLKDTLDEIQTDGIIKNEDEDKAVDVKDTDDKDIKDTLDGTHKEDLIKNETEGVIDLKGIGEDAEKDIKNAVEDKMSIENLDDFKMYENLEWKIEELEKDLCCQMDLAEDIDGGKRLSTTTVKPRELIVEYATRPLREAVTEAYIELDNFMRTTIKDALDFMDEHRHDPTEIYGEELYEEFMNIPDPTLDPKHIFNQFLYVLDELGPYAADKAAFTLLSKLEKLKIKIPYERHFLLLCLSTTVFVKIRCSADLAFSKCSSEWQKIVLFSNPKVLRFAEILQKFQPPENVSHEKDSKVSGTEKQGFSNDCGRIDGSKNDCNIEELKSHINEKCKEVNEEKRNDDDKMDVTEDMIKGTDELNTSQEANEESDKMDSNIEEIIKHTSELNIKAGTNVLKEVNEEKSNDVNLEEMMNHTLELNINIDKCKDDNAEKNYDSNKIDGNKTECYVEENTNPTNELNISKEVNEETQHPKIYIKSRLLNVIDNLDFTSLCNKLEDKVNTYEANLKDLDIDVNNTISDTDKSDRFDKDKKISDVPHDNLKSSDINANSNKSGKKSDGRKSDSRKTSDKIGSDSSASVSSVNKRDSQDFSDKNSAGHKSDSQKTSDKIASDSSASASSVNKSDSHDFSDKNSVGHKSDSKKTSDKIGSDSSASASSVNKSDSQDFSDKNSVGHKSDSQKTSDKIASDSSASASSVNKSDSHDFSDKNSAGHKSDSQKTSGKIASDSSASASSVNKSDLNSQIDPSSLDNSGNTLDKGILNKNILLPRSGRGRRAPRRRAAQPAARPDALCAVLYTKEPLLAKILFMLLVDMSRHGPCLSHVSAQYCAEPMESLALTEPNETQRRGRQQEDVLKKFRMHECNLLLATSALEEGIDLPRCNLVLRWDLPPNYRSYGLCRGRARAPRASTAILCPVEDTRPTCPNSTAPTGPTGPTRTTGPTRSTDPSKRDTTEVLLHNVATYRELDQIITRKCGCGIQDEPPPSEEEHADNYTPLIRPYTPNDKVNLKDSPVNENNTINDIDSRGNEYNPINENDNRINENDNRINENDNRINENDNRINENDNRINENDNRINENDNKIKSEVVNLKSDMFGDDDELTKSDDNIMKYDDLKQVNNETDSETDIEESLTEMDINKHIGTQNDIIETELKLTMKSDTKVTSDIKSDSAANVNDASVNKQSSDIKLDNIASVDLNSAIALINRYCGKLPSDTFTRLAPQWRTEEVCLPTAAGEKTAYICTLRLPLNCPVKYNIVGHPMPTRVLARRMVALQACRILHKSGELDNQLMPIGKENFKAVELESAFGCGQSEHGDPNDTARPGTTKRRQYYYKRTALAFTDCQPIVDATDAEISQTLESNLAENNAKPGVKRNMLYAIVSKLWCALPERYNTRGRRLHAPQNAKQAIGILMARRESDSLQIPAFPVYTRSGEVRVSVEYVPDADVRVSPTRGRLIKRFMRFVFSSVLRVRRRGMRLNTDGSTHNNYYVVPTIKSTRKDGTTKIDIDWAFLELIYQHTEEQKLTDLDKPNIWQNEEDDEVAPAKVEKKGGVLENPLLKEGEMFVFDAEKYREAVVTPWYRNQDQPQFFLVAEICNNLTPDSAFPSASHTSFRKYYNTKYKVVLTQPNQPLLDVDHTSARLNLLTPRYVNRKGVALPVSSERTRRAKRDRLDQKQMLVPELCRLHPFAAPLWFATVALPCVLYRINALLIADEIRSAVAIDVGLGIPKIDESTCPGFQWPPLDFGWSLAEVLNADSEKGEMKKDDEDIKREEDVDSTEKGGDNETTDKDGEHVKEECREKTINDILQEKEAQSGFEIGTWSNDMASSVPPEEDEYMEPLPSNLTFCTSASGGANWCDPVEKPRSLFNPTRSYSMADSDCSYLSSDFDTDDSDLDTDGSDDDTDTSGFYSGRNSNGMGVRIEYKTAREAEAVDEPRKPTIPTPSSDPKETASDVRVHKAFFSTGDPPSEYKEKFHKAVLGHKQDILSKKHLIKYDEAIGELLPEVTKDPQQRIPKEKLNIQDIFPYGVDEINTTDGQITLESIEKNKRVLLNKIKQKLPQEKIKHMTCFSMKDVDIDSPGYVNEKISNVGFDTSKNYEERIRSCGGDFKPYYQDSKGQNGKEFDFDYQPNLEGHPGPSPSVILQALTMSNANDGINLERLETIGDSFLKFAITAYLYCGHPTVHEGKLSHMRSKQVSNLNLYRLGRNKRLGARMIASKFEPHDNWLPPCHKPPNTLHPRNAADSQDQPTRPAEPPDGANTGCFIPYNLITQHSIPDKSIADCVEALIGAYLLECGPRGALLFMSWLGIRVLPRHDIPLPTDHPYVKAMTAETQKSPPPSPKRPPADPPSDSSLSWEACHPPTGDMLPEHWPWPGRPVGSLRPYKLNGQWIQPIFGELKAPPSPLLRYIEDPEGELEQMLSGYEALERILQYKFRDRSLLLQALTHASHHRNRLTDCYQRLEFLGDAILDYLITRHLYEDPRRHSPGALTDLRSALVNNTIFATLAARHGFHKYFRHMSPGLNDVLTKYVKIQEENGHSISEEHYLIQEDEMEQAEDVEVPKALGDLFESIAGAIFLDSGMSLGAVWRSYVNLMGAELEAFSAAAPKSPVRELLEAEPDTAKFGKPERLADGRRVRVCVEVFGRGQFKGIGRNYRIAKGTAARCALRHLRIHRAR